MIKIEKIKEFLMQIGYVRLLLLGICGFFLVMISMPEKKMQIINNEEESAAAPSASENDAYVEKMEKKLENILKQMDGVGSVDVMITLTASSEVVVNKDVAQEESKKSEETVLADAGGSQAPYVVKEFEPVVEGVVVIMEGGDNAITVADVTDAVQALFHVDAHKIKVLKMEDRE